EETGFKWTKPFLFLEAYTIAIRYHLGTIAQGSFVLVFTRPIRIVLDYLTRPVRHVLEEEEDLRLVPQTSKTCCIGCMMTCNCWESVMRRLSDLYANIFRPLRKSAYMNVALNGKPFLEAAADADWFLRGKNIQMESLDGASVLTSLSGSFCIAACGAILTRFLCMAWPDYSATTSANYIMRPLMVSFLSGMVCMLVSMPFCLAFDHVADTIYFCFCLDKKSYGISLTAEERKAHHTNRGCNLQSFFGQDRGNGGGGMFVAAHHPPKTQALYTMMIQQAGTQYW
ncbi:unnamed protein product, partial [Polarella glacialis]